MSKRIWCCGCNAVVKARLTSGMEIYPHRPDLQDIPMWRCDACKNYVGCHHKTRAPTAPLGCIPTPEIRAARLRIHRIIDPIWQSGKMSRKAVYAAISKRLGREYHTSKLRSIDEVNRVYEIIEALFSEEGRA